MTTEYDEYLAAVLDEPAEAAQVAYARHSVLGGLGRLLRGDVQASGQRRSHHQKVIRALGIKLTGKWD